MYEIILFSIFIIVFVGYNILNYTKFGILDSISASHYEWHKLEKENMFLFATWGYALPAVMLAESGFMFFAAALLFFVGIASDYRLTSDEGMTNRIHMISAKGSVVLALLSEIFDYKMYFLAVITILAMYLISKLKIKNPNYWIEIVACASFSYSLLENVVLK